MRRRESWRECQLAKDIHYRYKKACKGKCEDIAGVRLCQRHRDLVESIRLDAENAAKSRRRAA